MKLDEWLVDIRRQAMLFAENYYDDDMRRQLLGFAEQAGYLLALHNRIATQTAAGSTQPWEKLKTVVAEYQNKGGQISLVNGTTVACSLEIDTLLAEFAQLILNNYARQDESVTVAVGGAPGIGLDFVMQWQSQIVEKAGFPMELHKSVSVRGGLVDLVEGVGYSELRIQLPW